MRRICFRLNGRRKDTARKTVLLNESLAKNTFQRQLEKQLSKDIGGSQSDIQKSVETAVELGIGPSVRLIQTRIVLIFKLNPRDLIDGQNNLGICSTGLQPHFSYARIQST
ncbi:unnamed protein product [Schistosoma turkestanicum]|nr:unnamed protein product [Schistosoma turkestanicum]